MRIEHYIKELLYRYECVVVPGFGAFLTQRKPAQVHETTHAFYPPKKVISFNRQLSDNDGLLANYIGKAEGISYQKAMGKISLFVDQLTSSLNDHQEIVIEEIGTFYTQGDKILFLPSYHNNYLLDSFGLSSFTSEKIERENTAVAEEAVSTPIVELNPNEEIQDSTKEEKQKPNYLKYAAIGIIAIGVSGLLGANWYTNDISNHNIVEQQKAENQVEQKIQEATFVIDNPLPQVTFKVKKQKGKYNIVAGAFRLEENALKKIEQLKEQGFTARQIGVNKYGLHQVIYNSFENRLEALEALRIIKKNHNNEAWLLVKEL